MTKQDIIARDRFESLIIAESSAPWEVKTHAARLLMRHARTYARVQEAMCNGAEWSPYLSDEANNKRQSRHEAWCEKRDQQLERRIKQIVASLGEGFGVILGGDPRGCTVKLTVPSGETNDFSRKGICVPGA